MWVVFENHCIDYEGHTTVKVYGPFTSEQEAKEYAYRQNAVQPPEGRLYEKQLRDYIKSRGGDEWIDAIYFEGMEVTSIN